MEFAWETLARARRAQARLPRGRQSLKPEYKIELWLAVPHQRASSGRSRSTRRRSRPRTRQSATRLFGTDRWRAIYELRVAGAITRAEAREEYVNLMRWRLERDLGYRFTHPLELKNTRAARSTT